MKTPRMNEQQKAEARLDKVAQIMRLAAEITAKTERVVFVRFEAHVNWIEVEVCRNKTLYTSILYEDQIDLDDTPPLSRFDKTISRLQKYLTNAG